MLKPEDPEMLVNQMEKMSLDQESFEGLGPCISISLSLFFFTGGATLIFEVELLKIERKSEL